MQTNLKQKFLRTTLGALMLLSAPSAFAFPTSGTCAMLVTLPTPFGQTATSTRPYNVLATFTFTSATAGTANYNMVNVSYGGNAGPVIGTPSVNATPVSFTVAAGPITDSKLISFTPTGSTGLTLNAYAVNADKTILIQGANTMFSGVCQF